MSYKSYIGGKVKGKAASANFMRQFRDSTTKELKKLTSQQFMEVWRHYDKDGELFFSKDDSDVCWMIVMIIRDRYDYDKRDSPFVPFISFFFGNCLY